MYPARQLFSAFNGTQDSPATPNVTLDLLNNVTSRHMTFGQAAVLVDALKTKDSGAQVRSIFNFYRTFPIFSIAVIPIFGGC